MKRYLKILGLAAAAAMALTAFAASTATATILEVEGSPKTEKLEITATLKAGSTMTLSDTSGEATNTCTTSSAVGATESSLSTKPTGKLSSFTFERCTRPVTSDNPGQLYVEYIAGTTNGTVFSENAEVTVSTGSGTVNCKTGTGTDIGILTGVWSGSATMHINAVMNCGFSLPSALWKGTYTVTSPSGLGVLKELPPPPIPTTLEVNGTPKDEALEISASLETDTSATLARTDGSLANTCSTSTLSGATEAPFTGTRVTGKVSSLAFGSCFETVTVDKAGQLYVEHIAGTTNGTVFSENAEVTVKTPFGSTEVNCKTGVGADIGTLTGVKSGNATMDINAVLNCGFLLPSATWKGSYTVTNPSGLGVTDKAPVSTTLEVNGVPKDEALEISASLETGTSLTLARTDGSLANTCSTSTLSGATEAPFTGSRVTGKVSRLTFGSCSETVTVDKAGQLYVEHIAGTTNGTVFSENAEVTVKTPFGVAEVNCRTGEGTDIGTLTGKKTGELATMDINAVLNCGFLLPSATWKGSYTVTNPSGLGVTA